MNRRRQFACVVYLASVIMMIVCLVAAVALGQCTGSNCRIQMTGPETAHPAVVRIVNQVGNERCYGSGTLVKNDSHGLIVTCAHLFRHGVGNVSATFPNGRRYSARVLKVDSTWDLTAIEVSRSDATPVTIATQYPQQGDRLSSCGYGPYGRYGCNRGVAQGYTQAGNATTTETLQMSGVARDGDSGGPIFNAQGQLAGVIWGTDGRTVSGTYCGRVQKFLSTIGDKVEPPPIVPQLPTKPLQPVEIDHEKIKAIARAASLSIAAKHAPSLIERILPGLLAALGWTGPPALAAMFAVRILGRRLRRKMGNATTGPLNDDYAKQLADVFSLSGRSAWGDVTLGREYDELLRQTEESSNGQIAQWAKQIREKVAQKFYRIHGQAPSPAEPIQT